MYKSTVVFFVITIVMFVSCKPAENGENRGNYNYDYMN